MIGDKLQSVQNPCRYLGGEYGSIIKDDSVPYTFIMAFPDLYEIGMSNQAIKILYNGLNKYPKIRCERVFAVEPDFENLLKEKNLPLYSLESGIPLYEADCIGFSIGYELGITGVLSILDTGKIPLLRKERKESDPIIVAGGCGVTNPLPFSDFFDAVFIGEAENEFFDLINELAETKEKFQKGSLNGSLRETQLEILKKHPSVWIPDAPEKKAVKAFQKNFGEVPSVESFFPIPCIKPVQNHGVIEIMRGCPNMCRFCHAGSYYKPQRTKNPELILREADKIVKEAGFREISLTSLSSGDYPQIDRLLDILNRKFKGTNVSFQLPSLKVNSFTLPILEKLSEVRKSGLTFAVETPYDNWQLSVNKEVYKEKLIDIIMESKKRGWNKAKFYFMIGLPPGNDRRHLEKLNYNKTEEELITEFLLEIQEKTNIQCNVNIGTFIPKAHTPYQRVKQLTKEESKRKMDYIREHLPRGKFKVSTHDPFVSFIEGIISRGDERVGSILLNIYKKGCRMDAWEDHMRQDLWQEAIDEAGWDVEAEITRERDDSEKLPWSNISLGPSPAFFKREFESSINGILTEKCSETCKLPCGVCNVQKNIHVKKDTGLDFDNIPEELLAPSTATIPVHENNIPLLYRVIFSFSKSNGGEFLPHLATQETFHKAILRSSLPIIYTDGFNPLPRLELATCLSLGIESFDEKASVLLRYERTPEEFIEKMNAALPSYLKINSCIIYPITRKKKRISLATMLYGSKYNYIFKDAFDLKKLEAFEDFISLKEKYLIEYEQKDSNTLQILLPFNADKPFRNVLTAFFGDKPLYETVHITKLETLATNPKDKSADYDDFYSAFNYLASQHKPFLADAVKENEAFEKAAALKEQADVTGTTSSDADGTGTGIAGADS